jgi:hypothetical protein
MSAWRECGRKKDLTHWAEVLFVSDASLAGR